MLAGKLIQDELKNLQMKKHSQRGEAEITLAGGLSNYKYIAHLVLDFSNPELNFEIREKEFRYAIQKALDLAQKMKLRTAVLTSISNDVLNYTFSAFFLLKQSLLSYSLCY